MRISYSFGIVDLLHYGHIKALLEAEEQSDLHIFGLVSDEASINWMGTIVSNYTERKKVLENVSCINKIMYQKTLDPFENLRILHERYPSAEITLYHGDDWKIMPALEYLNSIGGKVIFTEYYEKLKPANIIQKLNTRNEANINYNNLISTKANTLVSLKGMLKKSKIENILIITVEEIERNFNLIFEKVRQTFNGKKIVVRSSSSKEDLFENSNAGHYDSVLNVDSTCKKSFYNAVNKVINSYAKDLVDIKNEQILIQRQTEKVKVSGVVFTREISDNRPYYVVNYDDSGSTDTVTSGAGGKTIWISYDIDIEGVNSIWKNLLTSIFEIQEILEGMILDIEFAINKDNEVIIFQVRPLSTSYKYSTEFSDSSFLELKNKEKLKYLDTVTNSYDNNPMILSDMAFWNPAEIIGDSPKNLDYSLYKEIITKRAWNKGLIPMGYTAVNHELMYKIANKPYISVDYSFMTLIPDTLENELKLKLVHFYKEKLKKDLTAHDKIEFEIVISCYDFDTESKLQELLDYGFSNEQVELLRDSLHRLTEKVYLDYNQVLQEDRLDLEKLSNRRKVIEDKLNNGKYEFQSLLSMFKTLLSDITLYGTPQFSRQARYAFISNAICKSLISRGYMSQTDMDAFFQSIQTVASDFDKDFKLLLSKKLCISEFNNRYGHLRSGTYNIRTPRYDQTKFELINQDKYISDDEKQVHHNIDFVEKSIHEHLEKLGFKIDPKLLTKLIKTTLEQREYFKFEFTKSLSLAIEILILMGEELSIEKSLLSYLELTDVYASEYYDNVSDLKEFWLAIIKERKVLHKKREKMILPEIVISKRDLEFIENLESRPNFITNKKVSGETVLLEDTMNVDISGKIVVITKADPGFDWIFTRGIKGLITKYGGVASHMAIRCAEFGIPAAIGCGEKLYNYVSKFPLISLDCKNETIYGGKDS